MISFELFENYDIRKSFKSLWLIALAESLGSVESLVCHPASMTHASIPKEIRDKVGITEGLIRLSIGIENINDFIADTLDMSLVDKVIKVNDDDAFSGARLLAQKEGIFAGTSSEAALSAVQKLIAGGAKGNIVVVLPDRGDRYFSKNLYTAL